MSVNPFTYGNPISEPSRFIGRQKEIKHIFDRLHNAEFESSSLVGERRVGKTSLINYLTHPMVRSSHGFDPDKYHFIYTDLQMVNKDTTPVQLWLRLLRQLRRYCQNTKVQHVLENIREMESVTNFDLEDLFDCIDDNDQYVVFLLNEFENVTDNLNFGLDFYHGLRSLAIHHNLALIISSRDDLIELSPWKISRASPFFNIFANINIGLFTEAEARSLISNSLADSEVNFTDEEINTIFHIAGFHPYFLQAACHFLFEAHSMKLDPDKRVNFLQKAFHKEAIPHLGDYWYTSNDQQKIVLTALALLERHDKLSNRTFSLKRLQDLYTRSEQTLTQLEKRGLLASKEDAYCLFNASFGTWICNEITNTLYDQQSYIDWLRSNTSVMERLSNAAKKDMAEILPKINDKYRNLIISWVSDPRNLIMVAGLFKTVLGLG